MENKLTKRQQLVLSELYNCEFNLMNAAAKIGINNKLEIYDRQLVEDYVNLKLKLTVLTNQFLNYDSKTINS